MIIKELNSKAFVESAERFGAERFIFENDSLVIDNINKYAPDEIIDKAVLRLKRKDIEGSSCRTILIAVLSSNDEIPNAFRWAANVKDELLNPEIADLYLFVGFKENSLNLEQSLKYEANDLFCRKFILRSEETIDEFMGRTFLPNIKSEGQKNDLIDPLYSALMETSKQHNWLTKSNIAIWKEAFLSGRSSNELIDIIITNLDKSVGNDTAK